jgi:hypothetical protein
LPSGLRSDLPYRWLPGVHSRPYDLRDAAPAELPVEHPKARCHIRLSRHEAADLVEAPTKVSFLIYLKAAQQIGLTIPPNVLARADKVIK